MLQGWASTLGAVVALLFVGFLLGRAWVLRRGRHDGRPQYGDHPHYLLGLNYLISNQPDLALLELSKAVRGETDAVEAYLALGNLFREKGQVERAIDIHKSLLHRSGLSDLGRLQALFSLGLDFKRAGLVDRAERTLQEVVDRDPENLSGWHCLSKVYEEMGRWEEAVRVQERIQELAGSRDPRMLASLWSELGREALTEGHTEAALRHFEKALELDGSYAPALLGLGDCHADVGDTTAALAHWERALDDGLPWASDALYRIAETCETIDDDGRLERACQRVLDRHPHGWRARLVQARMHRRRGEVDEAREALVEALSERPGSLTVQRELWETLGDADGGRPVRELVDEAGHKARLVDPFVCLRCGFKASEPFARCPHCHEWNTVAEEQA